MNAHDARDRARTADPVVGMTQALQDLIGVAEDPAAALDPVSFGRSLMRVGPALLARPTAVASAQIRLLMGSAAALGATAARAIGMPAPAPVAPAPGDRRFADKAFAENPIYFWILQQYLLGNQLVLELLDAAALPKDEDAKARFAAGLLVDAMAPTNTLLGNPAALRLAIETRGASLARGMRNYLDDLMNNGGWPSQVSSKGMVVGENMAATPGSVVYRSDLIEVLQYAPQTETVHEVPLLFCPPWINKFYIMDLAPDRSLIEWAVKHGHTVFAISYRNPDASMKETSFEDYLLNGPLDAVRVVREITGAESVNTVSVCLGGTLTAIALAHLAGTGERPINSATFLNTHTDFTMPGQLGTFTDEATVAGLEKRMARKGYLESTEMSRTFDLLRANDLVFQYVVNNWLMGKEPPAFDLLTWNSDGTRMPARMHSEYLRSCYLRNEFARGEFVVAGRPVDPHKVDVDTYVLAAVDDHIVPWQSGYKTTQLLGGDNRFVLSSSGHIAGIVNPPNPKAKHWTNEELPADPEEWKAGATAHDETWWEDWARWIAARGGALVAPPAEPGSAAYPVLGAAPGEYVRGRA